MGRHMLLGGIILPVAEPFKRGYAFHPEYMFQRDG